MRKKSYVEVNSYVDAKQAFFLRGEVSTEAPLDRFICMCMNENDFDGGRSFLHSQNFPLMQELDCSGVYKNEP